MVATQEGGRNMSRTPRIPSTHGPLLGILLGRPRQMIQVNRRLRSLTELGPTKGSGS